MTGMFDRGFERAADILPPEPEPRMPEPAYNKRCLKDLDIRILYAASEE